MNHQVLVRILHRFAHQPKQPQPFLQVQILFGAVFRDRQSIHILHHEVGKSVVGGSAVNQTGNEGMLQIGQNLPFLPEAVQHEVGVHAALQQLDGDFLLVLVVVPHGQVHRSHAAVPQQPEQPVRARSGGPAISITVRKRSQSGYAWEAERTH